MRNVKAAAIQPKTGYVPQEYSPVSGEKKKDIPDIMGNYVQKNLETTFPLLEKAGSMGCDIVCTCEDASLLGDFNLDISEPVVFGELVSSAERIADERYSAISKKYSMYVIGTFLSKQGENIFNTARIYDRNGNRVGEYHKTHLPANETWQCTPGNSLDVFELDFGKIGICICYDMMFPETVQIMALKGAEIIFHPTFGYGWYDSIGEATLRTRANDNGVYIVTSKNNVYNGAGKSSIIDYWGQIRCDAGFTENAVVCAEIDLDIKKTQGDWYFNSQMSGVSDVTLRMRRERRSDIFRTEYETANKNYERLEIPDKEKKLLLLENIKQGKCRW